MSKTIRYFALEAAVLVFASGLAAGAQPGENSDEQSHLQPPKNITLYGEVDIVESACTAAGITLGSTKIPSAINKVRLGSPAYYANLLQGDKVLFASITNKKLSLLIERKGAKFSVDLNTVPTNLLTAEIAALAAKKPIPFGEVKVKAPIAKGSGTTDPALYKGWIEKTYPDFLAKVGNMSKLTVLDVEGRFDSTSQTLEAFGVPYTKIEAADLSSVSLADVAVIIINCPGSVPNAAHERLLKWIQNGGYMLTTDWTLNNYDEKGLPGYLAWDLKRNKKADYVATAVKPDPLLFKNAPSSAKWHMDNGCQLVKILDSERVRILARSEELASEDPVSGGVLAAIFAVDKGQVLHLVGHFGNYFGQTLPDPAPGIGISLRQAIAGNFVVLGVKKSSAYPK